MVHSWLRRLQLFGLADDRGHHAVVETVHDVWLINVSVVFIIAAARETPNGLLLRRIFVNYLVLLLESSCTLFGKLFNAEPIM